MANLRDIGGERHTDQSERFSGHGRRLRILLLAAGLSGLIGVAVPPLARQISAPRVFAETELKIEDATQAAVGAAIAQLRSKTHLDNLSRALNLSRSGAFAEDRSSVLQVAYDILSGGGSTMAETEAALRARLSKAIELDYDKDRGTLAIKVTAGDAEQAKQLASLIATSFAGELSSAAGGAPDGVAEGLRQAFERAEAALSGFTAQLDANALADLRRVKSDRQALAGGVTQAESELGQLRQKLAQASAMTVSSVLGKPLPDSLEFTSLEYQRQRHVEAKLAADRLSGSLGPRHPRFLAAQGALEDVRSDIQQALKQLVASLQRDETTASKHLAELKARQAGLIGDKQKLEKAERLAALEGAVAEARENYSEGRRRVAPGTVRPSEAKVKVVKPAYARYQAPGVLEMLKTSAAGGGVGICLGLALAWIISQRIQEGEAGQIARMDAPQRMTASEPDVALLVEDDWSELDLLQDETSALAAGPAANDDFASAQPAPLLDHIRELVMANRRPASEARLPPLVAAVMARGASSTETFAYDAHVRPNGPSQEAQDLIALRREMADLRERVQLYAERRHASGGRRLI